MNADIDREQLLQQVKALQWVHQIDLGDGLVTPGRWPPHPLILQAYNSIDFRGKKVLDVGCWDGLWSFEAEKRGASEVVAIDDLSQREYSEHPSFTLAHRALKSRVRYHPDVSVYTIPEQLADRGFDIVVFCGVYYHLKNPLLALAKLRRVMKPGGVLIVEGPVIDSSLGAFAQFYYRTQLGTDPSNWWVPTIACLNEWIECSFFEVTAGYAEPIQKPSLKDRGKRWVKNLLGRDTETLSRRVVIARAVERKDPKYTFPDRDLIDYS